MTIVTTLPYASARQNTTDYVQLGQFLSGGSRELPGLVDVFLPRPERFNAAKTVWTSESGLNTWTETSGESHSGTVVGMAGMMPYIEFLAPGEDADGYEATPFAGMDWADDYTFVMPFEVAKDHPTFDYNTFGDLASSAKILQGVGGTNNWNGIRLITDSNETFYGANAAGPDSYSLFRDLDTKDQWNWGVVEYDATAGTVLATVNGFGPAYNFTGSGAVSSATSATPGGLLKLNESGLPFRCGGLWAFNGLLSAPENATTRQAFSGLMTSLCNSANGAA